MQENLPLIEFRFKRDWESRQAGWVQARSETSNGWHPLKYVRSIKSADRFVRKVIANRQNPTLYIELPILGKDS